MVEKLTCLIMQGLYAEFENHFRSGKESEAEAG